MRSLPVLSPLLLPPLLLVSACGGSDAPANNDAAAAAFVPPPVQRAKALPGQANATPLTAYVGKYPGDAVGGVGFYDRTEVAQALVDAVGDATLRHRIAGRDAVSVPIFRTADGRLAAHGCEPHNCGDRDWTFLVAPDGSHAEACYHDAETMGDASRWYAGAAPVRRAGDCPEA